MEELRIEVNGVSFYLQRHGTGTPLLLIAGLRSDSQSWAPVIEGLAAKHEVIVFDNRGVGRTEPLDVPLDIPTMADDAIAILDRLNITQAHVLGHSMGGMIALDLALRYPRRVNRLVLAASAARPSARDCALLRGWARDQREGRPLEQRLEDAFYWIFTERFFENTEAARAALEYSVQYPWQQTAEAFSRQVEAIAAFNAADRLAGLKPKTMILEGEHDILFAPDKAIRDFIRIHGLRMHIIPNAAHAIHFEAPGPFTEAVLSFLGE